MNYIIILETVSQSPIEFYAVVLNPSMTLRSL